MTTIQVVLDEELLQATDAMAEHTAQNRSALIRDALREHLKRLYFRDLEQRDREQYEKMPDIGDLAVWEGVASWHED